MISFEQILTRRTWRELRATAHAHGLPFNTHQTATAARQRLHERCIEGNALKRSLSRITNAEREALIALQASQGAMPWLTFCRAFGTIRPYRPWQLGQPTHPWKQPRNIAEKLWYLGLITHDREQVYAPAEVLALLPPLPRVRLTPRSTAAQRSAACLPVDLALLFGTLLRENVRVRWGRWLPPWFLKKAGAFFRLSDPHTLNARSELQTGRVRFLHYLAEAMGLVSVQGGYLKPTSRAWIWLEASPNTRWQMLREALECDLSGRDRLWDRYRLPSLSFAVWRALLNLLESLHPGQDYDLITLIGALRPYVPGESLVGLPELLEGVLSWLGVLTIHGQADRDTFCWHGFPPALPGTACARLSMDDQYLMLELPALPSLRPLAELLTWADLQGDALHFDADAMRRAAADHQTVPHIARLFEKLTGKPLPQAVWDRLERWARAARGLVMTQHITLTSPDSDLLASLRQDRSLRPMFVSTLAAHHLAVQPHHADELARRLVRRGLPVTDQRGKPDTVPVPETVAARADYLYLAGRVYQELGRFVEIPLPVPGAVLDGLASHLAEGQRGLLEQTVGAVVEAVQRALSNEAFAAAPAPAQEDPAAIRAEVERAFAEHRPLTVDYFSPAQGMLTRRTIEPLLPIVQQGDYAYVEAWCREAQAERTFRLDRIVRIVPDG